MEEQTLRSIMAKYLEGSVSEDESLQLLDELEKSELLRSQLNIMAAGLNSFKKRHSFR